MHCFNFQYTFHVSSFFLPKDMDTSRVSRRSEDPNVSIISNENDARLDILPQPDMTSKELIACLIAWKIKDNINLSTFNDLVSILQDGFPKGSGIPRSKYYVKKELAKARRITPEFVVFCCYCHSIEGSYLERQLSHDCSSCGSELTMELIQGNCQFLKFPIRKQLELYLRKSDLFVQTITEFAKITDAHLRGELHDDRIERFDIDITLAMDGGALYKKQGQGTLPVLLLINNIPTSFQLRFPVLGALFVGKKKNMPPRQIFLEDVCEQLRDLNENPISWTDSDGVTHDSRVFASMMITDAPEKGTVINQVGHGAQFPCHVCEVKGTKITREKYPHVFQGNKLRKTVIRPTTNVIGGGNRYPDIIEADTPTRRTAEKMLEQGLKALGKQRDEGKAKVSIKGILGSPAVTNLPGFDEAKSHVSDMLHMVFHGILQDLMEKLVKSHGKNHSFARNARRDFSAFNELLSDQTRCHEAERNAFTLDRYGAWTAFDFYMFLLHQLALYCSDDRLFKDGDVYEVLVHLSNAVYLALHGRITSEIIDELEKEIGLFCAQMKLHFKEEYCTYKWHMFQHVPHFLRMHGSAHWYDSFNMERFNLILKKLVHSGSHHQEFKQITENFILKFHNSVFDKMDEFPSHIQQILHRFSVQGKVFGKAFLDVVRKFDKSDQFTPEVEAKIQEALDNEGKCGDDFEPGKWKKVQQMHRRNQYLETADTKHPKGSMVRDCFVMVNGRFFGQIAAICYIPPGKTTSQGTFVIVVQKFEKLQDPILYEWGGVMLFPKNQIPFLQPSSRFPEYESFVLKPQTFIQKAHLSKTSHDRFFGGLYIFSVFPNEYVRS